MLHLPFYMLRSGLLYLLLLSMCVNLLHPLMQREGTYTYSIEKAETEDPDQDEKADEKELEKDENLSVPPAYSIGDRFHTSLSLSNIITQPYSFYLAPYLRLPDLPPEG